MPVIGNVSAISMDMLTFHLFFTVNVNLFHLMIYEMNYESNGRYLNWIGALN